MPFEAMPHPVIVIGAHRCGTTLLTRVIEASGFHWGSRTDEYNEDLGFRELNERLFKMAGARWDWPEPAAHRLGDSAFFRQAETFLRAEIGRVGAAFLATKEASGEGGHRGTAPIVSWGWKDPRNTFTLPLWLRLFPQARVVQVHRNGIDAAVSLWKRESSRPEGPLHPHYSAFCQTLEGSFSVWKAYTSRALSVATSADHSLSLKYEDLLTDTASEIERLRIFLGLDNAPGCDRVGPRIHASGADAHRNAPTPLVAGFAERVSCDPLLKNLGYR